MSDAYKVSYSPLAQDDIRAIFTYIAFELQAEQAAQGQVNRIRVFYGGRDIEGIVQETAEKKN